MEVKDSSYTEEEWNALPNEFRLRLIASDEFGWDNKDLIKAADEIERLRDEVFNLQTEVHFDDQAIKSFQVVNERLREALQKILDLNNFENIFEIASAALKDGE